MFRNVSKLVKRLRSAANLYPLSESRNMDVTRHNFKELLPHIQEAIDSASFLSIDGEFTGINAYRGVSPFDLPEQRYDKLQESARQFLLVQFGLCTFHYNPKDGSYTNQAYNFYVWPRPTSRQAPDPRFLCQTSSLDFLMSQNFDFNKLIRDGISYLRPSEVEKLRDVALERQEYRRSLNSQNNTPEQNIPIPPEQEVFIQNVSEKLEAFIESEDESIEIDRCNAFQRRLVYQTARQNFPSLGLSGLTRPGGERVISVSKDTNATKKLVDQQDQIELTEVEEAFGFSKVVKMISESKKLLVGHNMVLDICHTLNQFCAPLPLEYAEFKEMSNTVFPNILDTKLMANTIPFKDEIFNSSLNELLRTVSESPYQRNKINPRKEGYGYKEADDKYHEAGYDAYVTGLCLISMHKRMCKLCGQISSGVNAESAVLKPFLNKLYLMKVADIPYMNLGAADMYPDRDHVFHLEIPKEWKTPDVVLLFSQISQVQVFWINDTSVFVALRDKMFANTVLPTIQSNMTYKISTYKKFVEREEAAKLAAAAAANESKSNSLPPPNDMHYTQQPSPYRFDRREMHTSTSNLSVKAKPFVSTNNHNSAKQTGITPMLEKAFVDGLTEDGKRKKAPKRGAEQGKKSTKKVEADQNEDNLSGAEKRPVSPDGKPTGVKRSKSVVEEKTFEEPPWE